MPLSPAPYLADQLPLLVHADVETCRRPLDAHAAPKGVRLHDELGWGEQWEEREREVRGAPGWGRHRVETLAMHPDAGHCRHLLSGDWSREHLKNQGMRLRAILGPSTLPLCPCMTLVTSLRQPESCWRGSSSALPGSVGLSSLGATEVSQRGGRAASRARTSQWRTSQLPCKLRQVWASLQAGSRQALSGSARHAASCPQPRRHRSVSLCWARAAGGAVTLQLAGEA